MEKFQLITICKKLLKGGSKSKTKMGSMTSINSGTFGTMDFSEEDRQRFSATMREILNEMEPVCQGEQDFIINFFHLTGKPKKSKTLSFE